MPWHWAQVAENNLRDEVDALCDTLARRLELSDYSLRVSMTDTMPYRGVKPEENAMFGLTPSQVALFGEGDAFCCRCIGEPTHLLSTLHVDQTAWQGSPLFGVENLFQYLLLSSTRGDESDLDSVGDHGQGQGHPSRR